MTDRRETTRRTLEDFDKAVIGLPSLLVKLLLAPRLALVTRPTLPIAPGVYAFLEKDKPIYVGQSRNLRARLAQHHRPSSGRDSASFAFNLARIESLDLDPSYAGWRRADLELDPRFGDLFIAAKARVAAMSVQIIEIDDPVDRSLFEIYAAISLGTLTHNSFETH